MAKQTFGKQILADEAATRTFAERLAHMLRAGDVLLLSGEIGAGKTAFARALIQERLRATGRMEDVPSPTFTLIQTYDDGKTEIVHADLYRLSSLADTDELGLIDALEHSICLVEWPDRLEGGVPETALSLHFEQEGAEGSRILTLSSNSDDWSDRLSPLIAQAKAG